MKAIDNDFQTRYSSPRASCGPTVGLVSDAAAMGDAVSTEDNGADGGEDVVGNNIGGEDADGGEDVAGMHIGDVGDAAGDAAVDAAPFGEPLHTYIYILTYNV